jgi:valyl-tRNA synthetase
MRTRFRDWTENLSIDWCLSRQRYFGVPIPVWYLLDANGRPDYEHPIVADAAAMPVDPTTDLPKGYVESQRGVPGGFVGDPDVFDTWFTSSLTPQIASHWGIDAERHARLFPADVRPQGHDIIRTWAFYTIAKALLHEGTVPWRHALISGWILDPDRKKMSKSKGNVMTPLPLIETYTADAARYWAASARLGADTAFDENVWKIGKRLVTKLFNAAKFVLTQPGELEPISHELDRAFVRQLRELVERTTASVDAYQYAHALQETETFFWTRFTDTYLELTKVRARGEGTGTPAGRAVIEADTASGSAVAALRLGLSVLVRLFAPFLPFITEEIWSWSFAAESPGGALRSVHRAAWPGTADFDGIAEPRHSESFDVAIAALAAINKAKADAAVSVGREVARLVLRAPEPTLAVFAGVRADVLAAARVARCEVEISGDGEPGAFSVHAIEFAERPAGES